MVQMVPGTPRRKGIKSSINIIKTKPPPKTVAFFLLFFRQRKQRGQTPIQYQLKKTGGVGVPANCDFWAVDY